MLRLTAKLGLVFTAIGETRSQEGSHVDRTARCIVKTPWYDRSSVCKAAIEFPKRGACQGKEQDACDIEGDKVVTQCLVSSKLPVYPAKEFS